MRNINRQYLNFIIACVAIRTRSGSTKPRKSKYADLIPRVGIPGGHMGAVDMCRVDTVGVNKRQQWFSR